MTNMNKELALEVWLNVEESAKYLSGLIDGIVQESNIYRYAWNNNLVLSLMFDSYQTASFGTFGQCSEGDLSIDNENICFKFDDFGTVRGTWDIVNKSKGKSCIYHLYRAKSDPSFSKPDFDIHSDRDNAIYLAAHDDSSCILELNANKGLEKAKNFPNDAVIVIRKDRLNELANSINDKFTDDVLGDGALSLLHVKDTHTVTNSNSNSNSVIYDINGQIQLLANETAQKLVLTGLDNPTKASVADDILKQRIVTKKYGDLASYDYILRRFKVTWN
jgi:hypothetical protein